MTTAVRITCELAGAVADYAPALDALLMELSFHREGWAKDRLPRRPDTRKRNRPTRCNPAPDPLDCPPVPLSRETIGNWPVFRVSSPIVPGCPPSVAHFAKRIGVERAALLAPGERKTVVTSNTWTKSYRLPVRVLSVPRVVWFADTPDPAALLGMLRDCDNLGRKPAHGWGRIKAWHVEAVEQDWSWYATDAETGRPVLMRPLPLCPELPADLDGWRSDYGAVCPPYWHSDRYGEIVTPC